MDAASRVDGPLIAGAMRKVANRQDLTREERAALKRYEKQKEERLRWEYYGSIPQKHWRQMSGRQTKVINEQADRYGLPFGGPVVNLPKLARALHDFLAENAIKLAKEDDPLLQGGMGSSPALEDYRKERAALARLDRLEREKELLPRDAAREALGRVAGIIRGAGDSLQRQFGVAAVEILYEALWTRSARSNGPLELAMVMATSTITSRHQTREDLLWFLRQSRPRRLRSMRQFAEEEIVIPSGPFIGRRFRCARQPYTGLWFDQIDSGRWSRCVATGPTQSGKSLTCFVIPMLYHLFEMGETVICGLPDMDMAADKWREDILPVIDQSRFRSLLPSAGGGSRGGRVESLQFANGATLKFMSGGGSDKSRGGVHLKSSRHY